MKKSKGKGGLIFAAGIVVGYLASPLIEEGLIWTGKKALRLFLNHKMKQKGDKR